LDFAALVPFEDLSDPAIQRRYQLQGDEEIVQYAEEATNVKKVGVLIAAVVPVSNLNLSCSLHVMPWHLSGCLTDQGNYYEDFCRTS
jgi:hypothetical protein